MVVVVAVIFYGLRFFMGFEGGCGDCWWTRERGTIERDKYGHFDKDVKRWRKSFKRWGKKAWLVGLASCNINVTDKAKK